MNKRRIHPYVRDVFTFYDLFSLSFSGMQYARLLGGELNPAETGKRKGINKGRRENKGIGQELPHTVWWEMLCVCLFAICLCMCLFVCDVFFCVCLCSYHVVLT